jgi:hypothetical protein
MKKRWVVFFVLVSSVLLIGCGPKYYRPALGPDKPAEITVSAYTQSGCIECLQEEARNRNVQVKLKEVQSDLGWEIFFFPLYKGYRCIGIVEEPKSTPAVSSGTQQ